MKRIIKLINSERSNIRITSKKAEHCDETSYDVCSNGVDISGCISYSYDRCGKDYTSCRGKAYDYCISVDDDRPCSEEGQYDFCAGTQDIAFDE